MEVLNEKYYENASKWHVEQLEKFCGECTKKTLDLSHSQWHYYLCGEGSDVVLLLPGNTGKSIVFYEYIKVLSDHYKVIAVDYPVVDTMDEFMEDLIGLLDYETCDTLYIIGQSFGGVIGQMLVKVLGDRVNSLVLLHSQTKTDVVDKKIVKAHVRSLSRFNKAMKGLSFKSMKKKLDKRVAKGIANADIEEKTFWDGFYREVLGNTTQDQMYSHYRLMEAFWSSYVLSPSDFEDWKGKALIIESENDTLKKPPEKQQMEALFPQYEHYVLKGGNLMSLIRNKSEIIGKVIPFFNR